jgi:penicillin V acylase-like amidase (Ntn superfamily)
MVVLQQSRKIYLKSIISNRNHVHDPITLLTNHPKFDKHVVYVLPSYVRNKIMQRSNQVGDCKQHIQELYIS